MNPTAILAVLGSILGVGLLVIWGIGKAQKSSFKRGELSAREKALRKSAEATAIADAIAAQPISGDPDAVADGWDDYGRRRMRSRVRLLQRLFGRESASEAVSGADPGDETADPEPASGQ